MLKQPKASALYSGRQNQAGRKIRLRLTDDGECDTETRRRREMAKDALQILIKLLRNRKKYIGK